MAALGWLGRRRRRLVDASTTESGDAAAGPYAAEPTGSGRTGELADGAPPGQSPPWVRGLKGWVSSSDEPAWSRPVLLVIATLSAFSYLIGSRRASIEPFYGAAARSMSQSWRDFLYGAFDPAGTVTVDKLPGALWPQALSLRLFGFHIWAFVLPQALEGVATILVLYRAVKLLAGPVAGLIAALILATTPITVLLSRGNVSDSLLILFLVLAAGAATRAIVSGTTRPLYVASVWVGLAFQAKMMQAWLVLPGIWLTFAVAGAPALRARLAHICGAACTAAVVSLSWMSAVSLVPRHDRPFVDGSHSDSLFAQVFRYNGIVRFGHSGTATGRGAPAPFLVDLSRHSAGLGELTSRVPPGWHRLLAGSLGRDGGWLLPLATGSLLVILWATRRSDRRNPARAGAILWGSWLLVTFAAFSAGRYVNSYYVAALAPPIAALGGTGLSSMSKVGSRPRTCGAAAIAAVVTGGYALYLLRGASDVPRWLHAAVLAATVIALAALVAAARSSSTAVAVAAVAMVSLAGLLAPATAVTTSVGRNLGPFDSPFEPASVTAITQLFSHDLTASLRTGQRLRAAHQPLGLATETSGLAAHEILFSGLEVLPIGGFAGAAPSPTLAELQHDVSTSTVNRFLMAVSPANPDPRFRWIRAHCRRTFTDQSGPVILGEYTCAS